MSGESKGKGTASHTSKDCFNELIKMATANVIVIVDSSNVNIA